MKNNQKKYQAGDKFQIILNREMAAQLNTLKDLGLDETNCILTSLVFQTAEYDKLNKLEGNRILDKKNVINKKILLEKEGFKSTNPVIINALGQIIDGQHRRQAAEELEIPYKFIIDPSLTEKNSLDITIQLNNSSKPWGLVDYVNAYAETGNENYKKLMELAEELNTSISRTLIMYVGFKPSAMYITSIIHRGRFVYEEKKAREARKTMKELNELIKATMNPSYKGLVKGEPFCRAYVELRKNPKFKFRILKEQFEKVRYTFLNSRELRKTLVETYNYKRQESTKIQLED